MASKLVEAFNDGRRQGQRDRDGEVELLRTALERIVYVEDINPMAYAIGRAALRGERAPPEENGEP
jgi:hypothetical protein